MMQTIVQKWGNSLGIRIPASYAKDFSLKNGSTVELREEAGRLVIIPQKETLHELLSLVNEENIHEPLETGVSLGNEEW